MSAFTGAVTTRDVLEWAIDQGVFTEEDTQIGSYRRHVTKGVPGPWRDVLFALVTCAAEALADTSNSAVGGGQLDGFEDYVEARCLRNFVETFSLAAQQTDVTRALAGEIRLFFDASTINIDTAGLDGPVRGDLFYHCASDYDIVVPDWASVRADPNYCS